jgi:uncharacterized small protein (DUF1192 family)
MRAMANTREALYPSGTLQEDLMALFDDEADPFGKPRKAPVHHEIGQLLDALSVDELTERIEILKAEIARLDEVRGRKLASRQAADAFFKS